MGAATKKQNIQNITTHGRESDVNKMLDGSTYPG